MSNFYGQYRFSYMKLASPEGKKDLFDFQDFRQRLDDARSSGRAIVQEADANNMIAVVSIESSIYEGEGEHLFVDPDTEKVILNAIKNLSNKDMAKYLPLMGMGIMYTSGKPPILFHSDHAYGKSDNLLVSLEDKGILLQNSILTIPEEDTQWTGREDEKRALHGALRFALGVFMMKECFPESFKDGLPDIVKNPNWYKHQKNVKVSIDHIAHTVCPHIRSGHFRLLSSPRFKKKRGQVIFVKASMVHGKAEHTEKEEIDVH